MLGFLLVANLKMLVRDRQALFWALVFPLIFVGVFGLFNLDAPPSINLAVVDYAEDDLSQRLIESLRQVETFQIEVREDEDQARQDLKDGDLRYLLVIPEGLSRTVSEATLATITLIYDEGSPTSAVIIGVIQRFLGQMNLEMAQAPSLLDLSAEGILARRLDYFDFLLPGFVAMGVMIYSIIGLASTISLYRQQKILKRILATPLRVRTFFTAQILAYLLLSLAQAAIILAAGMLFFGGQIYGNYLYIGLLVLLGNLIFLNLGFIVGAFTNSVRSASGLGNAVALPMMFFSGVFFPTDGLPGILATVVKYFPLTPMLDAMRGVALEARPIWDFPQELLLLVAWIAVTSLVAIRTFRFG